MGSEIEIERGNNPTGLKQRETLHINSQLKVAKNIFIEYFT